MITGQFGAGFFMLEPTLFNQRFFLTPNTCPVEPLRALSYHSQPKITNTKITNPKSQTQKIIEIIEYTCNKPKNEIKKSQYFLAIQTDAKI